MTCAAAVRRSGLPVCANTRSSVNCASLIRDHQSISSPACACGTADENRAEVDVAPRSLAFGARLFGLAPGVIAGVNRRLGSDPLADAIAEGQRDKR